MTRTFESAKDEITKALIQEYLKRHPGVDEQQVVVSCRDGKLIFSDIAAVMAAMKKKRNYDEAVINSAKMIASLAIQENERWEDCCKSTEHCRLILDCLNSSTFGVIDTLNWREGYNFLKKGEQECAKCTIYLESSKEKIAEYKKDGGDILEKKGKKLITQYLNFVVEQLKVLHRILKNEVTLSEKFEDEASGYVSSTFTKLERLKNKHIIETRHFNKIYQTLKNDKKVKLCEAESIDLNKEMLLETRNSLEKAIDEMKEHTEQRRSQFHEIWDAVVSMERTIHEIDESDDPATSSNTPPKETSRMARFSRTDKNRRP